MSLSIAGMLLLAYIPISFFFIVGASASAQGPTIFHVYDAQLVIIISPVTKPLVVPVDLHVNRNRGGWRVGAMMLPRYYDIQSAYLPRQVIVGVPLWLLACICLAWPVTSFILARRKPKRGFPVEVAPSSGVGSGPPLPPGGGGREATG